MELPEGRCPWITTCASCRIPGPLHGLYKAGAALSSAPSVQGTENCKAQRSGHGENARGSPDSLPAEEKGIMNREKRDNDDKSCSEVFISKALL